MNVVRSPPPVSQHRNHQPQSKVNDSLSEHDGDDAAMSAWCCSLYWHTLVCIALVDSPRCLCEPSDHVCFVWCGLCLHSSVPVHSVGMSERTGYKQGIVCPKNQKKRFHLHHPRVARVPGIYLQSLIERLSTTAVVSVSYEPQAVCWFGDTAGVL